MFVLDLCETLAAGVPTQARCGHLRLLGGKRARRPISEPACATDLPQWFKQNGWWTTNTGKTWHNSVGYNPADDWSDLNEFPSVFAWPGIPAQEKSAKDLPKVSFESALHLH